MEDYEISFELFKEVMVNLPEEELNYCYDGLKYGTVINTFYFKCFDYARSKEMFLNVSDNRYYNTIVEIKDLSIEHPLFKHEDMKQAVFNACEYIMNYKRN